jgi:hypothetical protein
MDIRLYESIEEPSDGHPVLRMNMYGRSIDTRLHEPIEGPPDDHISLHRHVFPRPAGVIRSKLKWKWSVGHRFDNYTVLAS